MEERKVYDPKQVEALQFKNGSAIVLAAPGCGKTELLGMRIFVANSSYKIPFSEMLCLTFTNRASREMKDRVCSQAKGAADKVLSELFVGNIHRFCIRFLFENHIIPSNTSIIDDTDQEEILGDLSGGVLGRAWQINLTLKCAYFQTAQSEEFPEDICSMYRVKEKDESNFSPYAQVYNLYKKEEQVIDFEDILLLTYKALSEEDYQQKYKYSSYDWIEIDEVQDLNPLQFAIVEKLRSNKPASTIVYFGDERQAIFSFIGAKKNSIAELIKKCDKSIFLSNNYRCPQYLLDFLNDYAINELGIDNDCLPETNNKTHLDDSLISVKCENNSEQYRMLSIFTRVLFEGENENTAILVRTNDDVEHVSAALKAYNTSHMKLSKKDMFKAIPFKTIYSHFAVVASETRYTDWTQLLYRTRSIDTLGYARRCVKKMKELYLTPHDLMMYDNSSYFIEFAKSYSNNEIVVFDTETTGINIFEDDIIQIAAIKMKNGLIVPHSAFEVIIETDKKIPQYLGAGIINPMLEIYNNSTRLSAQKAFELFLNYVGDCEVLGHNVEFDVNILVNNLNRRAYGLSFQPKYKWDTLKMSRLINPSLRSHSLENLLETYSLEGENTHNAIDDILATVNLANCFYPIITNVIEQQKDFIAHEVTQKIRTKLIKNYLPIYTQTKQKIYSPIIDEEHTFTYEFQRVYECFLEKKYIEEITLFSYMKQLFDKVVINHNVDKYFNQQLLNHLYDYRTFNEADLFQNKIIDENVFVMTIHKAKGLEFDNVLLYNISDGVYPNDRFDDTSEKVLESKKVLYVAMSRAKKRLYYTYLYKKSRFLTKNCILEHFDEWSKEKKDRLLHDSSFSRRRVTQ